MFSILLMVVSATDAIPAKPVQETAVKGLSVSIPSEIAPAIKPYMDCLTKAGNVALSEGRGTSGDTLRTIADEAKEKCGPDRKLATENASQLLEKYPNRSEVEKTTMIEGALQSAERLSSAMADMMDKMQSQYNETKKSDAPNQ